MGKNNGGCSSQRTCTNNNFVATCGPCPKGYHAKGKACEKDTTTTTPQPNCVFCERQPPIASMLNTLNTWFHSTSRPGGGTYMTTGLNYLLQKKGTAKTLYLLADGETAQGQATLVNAGKSGGVPIHVVGVDLRTQDGGYKNLHALKVATGGTEKYI